MKQKHDWITTILGISAAVTLYATNAGYIDQNLAVLIGGVIASIFGAVSNNFKNE